MNKALAKQIDELFRLHHCDTCHVSDTPIEWFDAKTIALCDCWVKEARTQIKALINSQVIEELKLYSRELDKIEGIIIPVNTDLQKHIKELEALNKSGGSDG